MNVEFINPFLQAAKNVLETMCQTHVHPAKPTLKENTTTYGDVTGTIGMASAKVSGCMILSFSEKCIVNVVANMLMEDAKDEIDEEIIDAVGELTNMICGGAKATLGKMNHKFDLATPTMITGKGVEISTLSESPTIVIPFDTEYGGFVIEANLAEKG
jgi:chemotaxis protein CheX